MSQLEEELVDFLVEVCEADDNHTYLDALLAKARASIAGGGTLGSLTNASLNGKSFNKLIHLSALEVARACQRALRIYTCNENEVATTNPDFSRIIR